jgi:3-oxoadipate enol-lactonase
MPFIRTGEIVMHYRLDGPANAPTVVMSNSIGTTLDMWEPNVAALAEHFRVLRYDTRGHGLTESGADDAGGVTIALLADDVAALMDALRIDRAHVVGLSLGGMTGQRFAAAHPDRVDKLVLCATASKIGDENFWNDRADAVTAGGMAAIAGAVQRWFTADTYAERSDLVRGFITMLARADVPGYAACSRAIGRADLHDDLARIRAQTLVLSGSDDPATPPADGESLRDRIAGAHYELIENASHQLAAERPAAVNALITGFLRA